MTDTFIKTNGLTLHIVQAGPADGPLVILLHGFPECWYGWKHQIEPLAAAGYRVWVPDQRGYNLSDKPDGLAAYTIDALAADVVGLTDAAGRRKAVVGHDWGAAVAWWTAATHPERVERLVVLNVPHPAVMKRFASRNVGQLLKSCISPTNSLRCRSGLGDCRVFHTGQYTALSARSLPAFKSF